MLTRRALFKVVGALGLGTLLTNKILGEQISVVSSTVQGWDQRLSEEDETPLKIEAREELLDSVDCMELAERYGSFEKVGGYLGGFHTVHGVQ